MLFKFHNFQEPGTDAAPPSGNSHADLQLTEDAPSTLLALKNAVAKNRTLIPAQMVRVLRAAFENPELVAFGSSRSVADAARSLQPLLRGWYNLSGLRITTPSDRFFETILLAGVYGNGVLEPIPGMIAR